MTWQPLAEAVPMRGGQSVALPASTTLWANDLYVVHCRVIKGNPGVEPMYHLSIRNQDRSARHDWRDFQRIKNQLAGPEYEGVEIYPAESRKVDTSNQYHLWCFPFTMGFGLGDTRMVTDHEITSSVETGAVQRDNEPIDGPQNSAEDLRKWEEENS